MVKTRRDDDHFALFEHASLPLEYVRVVLPQRSLTIVVNASEVENRSSHNPVFVRFPLYNFPKVSDKVNYF